LIQAEEFDQALFVRVAGGAIAIRFYPLRMLDAQVLMNLLLQLNVRMTLDRHDISLVRFKSKTDRFHNPKLVRDRALAIARARDFLLLLLG
jgi:hypothetical protein